MSGFLLVLVFAMSPAAGDFAGGLIAEFLDISERARSLALHLAAGVVLAGVGLELAPQALKATRHGHPPRRS